MSERIIICLGTREYSVDLIDGTAQVNGDAIAADDVHIDSSCGVSIRSGQRLLRAVLEAGSEEGYVTYHGRECALRYETERHRLLKRFASGGGMTHGHADVKASMPGMVVQVRVSVGSEVKKGQAVLILEAMKMENEIRAPIDGTVMEVRVARGNTVEKGDLLMVLA